MTARILAMFLMSQLCVFAEGSLPLLPDYDDDTAMKLEAEADIAFDFDPVEKTIGLGITQSDPEDGSRQQIRFKLEDLKGFFGSQRHKEHVVVIFKKSNLAEPEMTKIIGLLKDYFIDRGYQRVTVQQYLAFGRGTYLDYKHTEPQR